VYRYPTKVKTIPPRFDVAIPQLNSDTL